MSEEYKAPKAKVKLFDRIFKPQVITIANGHTTVRPRSRMGYQKSTGRNKRNNFHTD